MGSTVRLFLDHDLHQGQLVALSRDHAHYLFGVMRLGVGATVEIFNGRDGAWSATVVEAGKKKGALRCDVSTRPQQNPPDVWLMFAPIKKARTDFIVEKATEMGASRILPVQTDFTNSERIRQDRLQAHAIEAAEQCGGTYVPPVEDLQKLTSVLDGWPKDRHMMFCDEVAVGQGLDLPKAGEKWAILIGPEGGFSPKERDRLLSMDLAQAVSLGPRILRADTAVVAALTVWQQQNGDWA